MPLTLLPAVDIAGGRVVRLVEGDVGSGTMHGEPRDAAVRWQADGAEWIHLVDLDAALGRGSNAGLLAALIGELDVNVQLSCGVRDDASLDRALSTGCERVVVGTAALEDPAWCARTIESHGDRIAIALDVLVDENAHGSARHRLVARGGHRDGGDLWETVARLDREGCVRYIVTDVRRDGMLGGTNIELCRAVARSTVARVIASGGISTIEDLATLADAAATDANIEGAIVGSALYAGRFTLQEALESVANGRHAGSVLADSDDAGR